MFGDLTFEMWIALISGLVILHVGLLVLSRHANTVALLGAAFMLLSLLGAAEELEGQTAVRLARVYIAVITVIVGIRRINFRELGGASLTFLVFIALYVLAGTWSDAPVDALLRKGTYALPMIMGILLAYSLHTIHDFNSLMRIMATPALLCGAFFAVIFVGGSDDMSSDGRIQVLGLNANRTGTAAATMLIICAYIAMYVEGRIWRVLAYVAGTMLAVAILYTGSRSAVGFAVIGGFVVLVPTLRRPVTVGVLAAVLLVTGFLLQGRIQTTATERLTEVSLTGRDVVWYEGLEAWKESPMIGVGWMHSPTLGGGLEETVNLHSIYVQTAAETGIVGSLVFLVLLLVAASKAISSWRQFGGMRAYRPPLYLGAALCGGILAHGFVASSALIGSNLPALFLPFTFALFERLPRLAENDALEMEAWEDANRQYEDEADLIESQATN